MGADPTDLPSERDRIFLDDAGRPTEFRFDESVAKVFPDMLRRSIPGYSALVNLIGVLGSRVVKSGGLAYDLGCSLGAVSLSLRHGLGARDAKIIAVDNSAAMVERCRQIVSADSGLCPIEVVQGDIESWSFSPCSLVVLNFTLQFAPLELRGQILQKISEALLPGGAVVLSEKTVPEGHAEQDFFTEMHDAFRSSNGYSQLEMSRKRQALENVLVPQSDESYRAMLSAADLAPIEWFRCLHFVSWVGIKGK